MGNIPEIKLIIENNVVKFSEANGWNVEFVGADFSQIVDDSLVVHTPLNDTVVKLSFNCSKDGNTIEKDCALQIKGTYGAQGKKPNMIPEPAQWHSSGGVLKKLNTYSYDAELAETADAFACEFYKVTGEKIISVDSGDISFSVNSDLAYLGKEGYEITCDGNSIKVQSAEIIGAVWAGRTICQLMAQGGFPNGIMRDYPRYSVRGFMLDVGRRPVSLEMLRKIVDSMSWYKMNDLQLHLSDNYIWLEDYAQNGDESTFDAYQAFRLESSLCNEKGETPTAKDYSYSKSEFNRFIKESLKKGVRIVPEIDVPAHALAFTKVFPEYAVMNKDSPPMKQRPLTDHIDISRPEAVEFVKKIFDEYVRGENPVFPKGTVVHIGADEFLTDYGAYRRFINELVPHLKETNTVRLWGSFSWIKDEPPTPIAQEAIDGVQMNLWSCDWADGREMYDMGYQLINTIDRLLYIVPNGTKKRAPYMDLINKDKVFKQFEPNRICVKEKGQYIDLPAGNKQMLGSCYAIWQDNIDKRTKGINEQDLYDRFIDSAAVMAEKNWGACTDKKSAKEVDAAREKINIGIKSTGNDTFTPVYNVKLNGGASFIESGCRNIPTGKKLKITVELDEVVPGQILMEADAPYGTYDIRITKNGKLGFTAQNYEYEFNYELVPSKKLKLTIDTKPLKTVLKIGLFGRKKAIGSFYFNGTLRNDNIKNTSFSIPTARIGSKTNSVKGFVYDITLK